MAKAYIFTQSDNQLRIDSINYIYTSLRAISDSLIQNDFRNSLTKSETASLAQIEFFLKESLSKFCYLTFLSGELPEDINFWAVPHRRKLDDNISENLNLSKIEEKTHQLLAILSSNGSYKKALSCESFLCHIFNLIQLNVLRCEHWETNILRFLGNISTNKLEKHNVYSNGFAKWCWEMASRPESSIFIEAWRVLWNLKGTKPIYFDGIYPLVPPWKTENPAFDIILIHGIKGGASYTWRQHDSQKFVDKNYSWVWPLDWMSHELKLNGRIIALNYQSDWWHGGNESFEEKDFESICREFAPKLKLADVGSRPIVWIGHSMGGIIIKKLLEDNESTEPSGASNSLISSTSAVIFMAVPHFGSFFASCSLFFEPLLRPSILLRQMKADNPRLETLNDSFVSMCKRHSIKVVSIVENQPSKITPLGPNVIMVPETQADAGVGEFYKVDATHLDICKPENRCSKIYVIIKNFIEGICDEILRKSK